MTLAINPSVLDAFAIGTAVLLAGVFAVSATTKLRDLETTRFAVLDYGLVGPRIAYGAAIFLGLAEGTAAVLLVVRPPIGLPLAGSLLAFYTGLIVITLARGLNIDCHCGPNSERVGRAQLGCRTGCVDRLGAVGHGVKPFNDRYDRSPGAGGSDSMGPACRGIHR